MDIAKRIGSPSGDRALAAYLDNSLRSLHQMIVEDVDIELIGHSSEAGERVYWRSLVMLLVRAASEALPGCQVRIEHSLSHGIYGEIKTADGAQLNPSMLGKIEQRMRQLVEADEPFVPFEETREEAARLVSAAGDEDKASLILRYGPGRLRMVKYGPLTGYYYGDLVPSAGYLSRFSLRFYLPGFILLFPRSSDPRTLPRFEEQRKLARVFYEAETMGRTIGISDVLALNRANESGDLPGVIEMCEAIHERSVASIADRIARDINRIGLVLIAGPTSSGKTTFSRRLSTHLRINGITPHAISLDDYFVGRDKTPRDASGQYDFESIKALDLELFNDHLARLLMGEEVEIPSFNFETGEREFRGHRLRLGEHSLLVIEGIHGLNDELTSAIPKGRKYRIYASALTQLNMDDHNRIQTTDTRLVRRIVRDYQFRAHSASETIHLWRAVRAGEERNIFPFQEQADVMFNSALSYELAVLRPFAEPLLKGIDRSDRAYGEAERLLEFLQFVVPFHDLSCIPSHSILREFIGSSCFER